MTHLIFSADPLIFAGQAMSGLCGAMLPRATPVFFVDLSQRGMPALHPGDDCPVCIRRAEGDPRLLDAFGAPGWAGKRLYLYAVAAGREERPWAERVEREGAA